MKGLPVVIVVLTLTLPCLAQAQPPNRGPEIQKLGYWVGTWKGEGEFRAGLFGTAGKTSATEDCEWFAGGVHVVCRGEATGPNGKVTALAIYAYDAAAKVYTYHAITSRGETQTSRTKLSGNTRTWRWAVEMAGRRFKGRITNVEVSPTLYTYKNEAWDAGAGWTVIEEGKYTKAK